MIASPTILKSILGVVLLTVLTLFAVADAGDYCQRAPARDPAHIFQRKGWSWKELKECHVVMQKRDFSCGAAALATLVRYFIGDDATEDVFLKEIDKMLTHEEAQERLENGLTLTDLKRVAIRAGYDAAIGKLSFKELTESKVPVIVGITDNGYDHFVVYRGYFGVYVYFADPIHGNWRQPAWEFVEQWQKNAVLVVAKPNVDPPKYYPLLVKQYEVDMGWLNRLEVRKDLSLRPY